MPAASTTIGALYALAAAMCFAAWNVFLQRALQRGSGDGTRLSLFTLSAGLVGVYVPITLGLYGLGRLPLLHPAGGIWFLVAGLLTGGAGPYLATQATWRIGAARSVVIRLLDPLFAFVIAFLFLGERVGSQPLIGVALIVLALGLLQKERTDQAQAGMKSGRGAGFAAAVAASLCFTLGSVARKSGLLLLPSVIVSSAGEGLGGLLIVLPVVLRGGRGLLRDALKRENRDYWLASLGNIGGVFCLNSALQRVPVPVAVAVRNTSPWFALLFVPLVLGMHQRPGRWTWLSTALLTGGMLLIVLR